MKQPRSSLATPPSNSPPSDRVLQNPLSSPRFWRESPVFLPSSPGVYWFLDEKNNVIYVGKAKNLSHRLHSYASAHVSPKVRQLVATATTVQYKILDNELEALLTEAELIHLHQPYYNSLLKDDKSPLYIITTKEKYPRVLTVRKNDLSSNQYSIRRSFGPLPSGTQVKEVLRIVRKLFPYCTATKTKKGKACFYSHLGLCPGACTGSIPATQYRRIIRNAELFLSGKYKSIISSIKTEIGKAAKKLDFETAGMLKTKIEAIEYVVSHYKTKTADEPLPQLTGNRSNFANLELKRLLKKWGIPLIKLDRIECYDVANLQGTSPAVSLVVTINGEASPSQYRHFAIKSLSTPNDVGMLKEALTRRQNHPEWGIPDLIVIDGGKGQVKAVKKCLSWHIPVVGIAKEPDRLVIPPTQVEGEYQSFPLLADQPSHQLLIGLRNEAHRFARRLFHKRNEKRLLRV